MELSNKKILFVVAPKDFRDEELFKPLELLKSKGAETTVASKTGGIARGMLGGVVATADMDKVDVRSYDAVVFVGGTGAEIYFNDTRAISIAKMAYAQNKLVAAICIAPVILANAGLLKGRNATAYASEAALLRQKGANYTAKAVEQDGKIITASGPQAAREFAERIADALAK